MSTPPEKTDDSSVVSLPSTEISLLRAGLPSAETLLSTSSVRLPPFPRIEGVISRNSNPSAFRSSSIRNTQPYPKTIVLSDELESMVADVSLTLGRSEQEVILAGINLVRLAIKARNSGRKLAIIEQNQPFVSEVVGFEV